MAVVVKPKDMRARLNGCGTKRAGTGADWGWVFLLSALASGSAVLSPLLIGEAVNGLYGGDPVVMVLGLLTALYVGGLAGAVFAGLHNGETWASAWYAIYARKLFGVMKTFAAFIFRPQPARRSDEPAYK